MTQVNPVLAQAANGGVVRNEDNTHAIDRLLLSKLIQLHIRDEKLPLTSKCYVLTSKGKKVFDASLPKAMDMPESDSE
jgi:hypothetical protein